MTEMVLPDGASPPLHVHTDLDDSFYVLHGRMVVRCGDDVKVATAGSWVPFPAGVPHTFRVVDGPARTLQVHRNDHFLQAVHALGHPTGERHLPSPTAGPGIEVLAEVLARYGIVTVGASLGEEEAHAFLAALPS